MVIHPDCELNYAQLEAESKARKKPQSAIWKAVQTTILRAKTSAQFADVIPGGAIPSYFRDKYGVANLYCVDLADFHRGFYTIEGRKVVLLDIVDHAQYDKWFPNKGK